MKQLPLPMSTGSPPTFDSFFAAGNGAALQHLRELDGPAAPVYLWGPAGAGKTHLLRALVELRQQRGDRVGWFDGSAALPWRFDEAWTLVVLDECDAFDAARQHAAFALFVEATTAGLQIAGAGRLPPVDLPLRDDLRTRLGWGHVFAIQPLSEAEARAALRREADRRGLFLSDEVMGYLLTHFQRDMKHLMDLLERIDGFAWTQRRAVTVPLFKQMLAEEGRAA